MWIHRHAQQSLPFCGLNKTFHLLHMIIVHIFAENMNGIVEYNQCNSPWQTQLLVWTGDFFSSFSNETVKTATALATSKQRFM